MAMKQAISKVEHGTLTKDSLRATEEKIKKFFNVRGKEKIGEIRQRIQLLMMEKGSVFRNEEGLKKGIEEIRSLMEHYKNIGAVDKTGLSHFQATFDNEFIT